MNAEIWSGKASLVQKHQLDTAADRVSEIDTRLNDLAALQAGNADAIDNLIDSVESLLAAQGLSLDSLPELEEAEGSSFINLTDFEDEQIEESLPNLKPLEFVDIAESDDWDTYLERVKAYAEVHNVDLSKDPYEALLSPQQRQDIQDRIDQAFASHKCQCDKYDYMIATACGTIGGLIDIFFVGAPGESKLGDFADKQTDKLVEKFAKLSGWEGSKNGVNSTKSAIGFLERKFKVNYDHRHGADVNNLFKMRTTNHHLKSMAHSPDLIGLIYSIINQFANTATFVDKGSKITVSTEDFELQGSCIASKIFCGFCNWLGHLFSDMAGSSGSSGRGSGIPMPFAWLSQYMEIGSFGKNKQSFATIACQVFEEGYDFRHGIAMAIPVAITDIMIRFMWVLKRRFYHKLEWNESIPSGKIPEINRMLLVGHGTLCLMDLGDATVRSGVGTDPVSMLLRMNLVVWVRLSRVAYKECLNTYKAKENAQRDIDQFLDEEYRNILGSGVC